MEGLLSMGPTPSSFIILPDVEITIPVVWVFCPLILDLTV